MYIVKLHSYSYVITRCGIMESFECMYITDNVLYPNVVHYNYMIYVMLSTVVFSEFKTNKK